MAKLGFDKNGTPTMPTDDFGYVNYLKTFLEHTETLSKNSGRSTRILASLKPGDILIVHNPNCVKWMKEQVAILRDIKGKRAVARLDGIKIYYTNPRKFKFNDDLLHEKGNLVFDHAWMYLHIQWRLENILEFPVAMRKLIRPKGADSSPCPTFTYSGQIWPEDTGKVQH